MSVHVCTEPGCDDREFQSAGALRFHNNAKHGGAAGLCEQCDPPREWRNLKAHQRGHNIDGGAGGTVASGPGTPADAVIEPDTLFAHDERPPTPPPGSSSSPPSSSKGPRLRDRVRGKLWGGDDTTKTKTAGPAGLYESTAEKKPRTTSGKRATTAPIMSMLWGGAGAALERSGADIPVGRTLQFQSEAAGDILDRLIARTWLDKLLQPFASKTDELEAVAALFAMPVLVAVVERSPAAAETVGPLLREAVRANVTAMAPVIKRRRADEKKFAAAVAELDPDLAGTDDPVGMILAAIFAPPREAPPASEPAPAANGQHEPAAT